MQKINYKSFDKQNCIKLVINYYTFEKNHKRFKYSKLGI